MQFEQKEIEALMCGNHTNPHRILGIHKEDHRYIVRARFPEASAMEILCKDRKPYPMVQVKGTDIFEGFLPQKLDYRLRVHFTSKAIFEFEDPYQFLPTLSNEDLFLFNQGNHHRIYEKLGAHAIKHEGINGYAFGVWAPNARRVSVVGDFNQWDGRIHPMRLLENSGIWELFIPNLEAGQKYDDADNQ